MRDLKRKKERSLFSLKHNLNKYKITHVFKVFEKNNLVYFLKYFKLKNKKKFNKVMIKKRLITYDGTKINVMYDVMIKYGHDSHIENIHS